MSFRFESLRFGLALMMAPVVLVAGCSKGGSDGNSAAPVAAAVAPAGQKWEEVVVKTADGGFRMGNPDAALKLVEYGSRSCPHCAAFDAEGFPKLKEGLIASGKLSYEFRDFPVHGALDLGPILLGQCVEPALFFPMLDQMMANQQTLLSGTDKITQAEQTALNGKSPNEVAAFLVEKLGYLDFVKQRGLPEDKARACVADKAALDLLSKNLQAADQKYHVSSTPTFILNDKIMEGVDNWETLKPALAKAGG